MKAATRNKKQLLEFGTRDTREVAVVGAQKMSDEERQAIVWERRLRGMSYGAIARDMRSEFAAGVLPNDYDAKAVYKDSMAVIAQIRDEYREGAYQMIEIELNRFDTLLNGVWEQAKSGDLAAVDRALAISKERRKMLGLDSAEKLEINWKVQIADLLQKGAITPQDVIAEFGEEALITVNQLMLERRDDE